MKGWEPIDKKDQTVTLGECPFCHGGETIFLTNQGSKYLMLVHWPESGVNCPARFEQVCDDQAQGAKWWNDRTPKGKAAVKGPEFNTDAKSPKIEPRGIPKDTTRVKIKVKKLTPRERAIIKLIDP